MTFGERLALLRKSKKISQERLSELVGVSRQAVSKWENNESYPETEKLILIAEKLDASLDYLLLNKAEISKPVPVGSPQVIFVKNANGTTLSACYKFSISGILGNKEGKGVPVCVLFGVDKHSIFGDHLVSLGYYATDAAAYAELDAINQAIGEGCSTYELRYAAKMNGSKLAEE